MLHLFGFFLPLLAAADIVEAPVLGPFFRVLRDMPAGKPLVDFFNITLGFGSEIPGLPEIFFAALLSFALMALIAALYKSTFRGPKLSQDYVHTLMILGIVVSVIVMVIRGGNGEKAMATGFGMFAAFSMIRFRTSLSEARDVAFIFFAMTAGLAVGARQYGLAAATTAFICAMIYWFSRGNWFAPNRASHYLRIRVTNDINYDEAFEAVFGKFLERHDLISVESIQAGMMTELRYNISLRTQHKPGELVSAIQQVNGNNRVLLTSAAPGRTLGTD
ncbi:MAG: DUF4956 domain-containing protein [Chthoniobacteraceae bacterium]